MKKHTQKRRHRRKQRALRVHSTLPKQRRRRLKKKAPVSDNIDRSLSAPAMGPVIRSKYLPPLLGGNVSERTDTGDIESELRYNETLASESFQDRLKIYRTPSEFGTQTVPMSHSSGNVLATRKTQNFLAATISGLDAQTMNTMLSSANLLPTKETSIMESIPSSESQTSFASSSMLHRSRNLLTQQRVPSNITTMQTGPDGANEFASKQEYPASIKMPVESPPPGQILYSKQELQPAVAMEVGPINFTRYCLIDLCTPRHFFTDTSSQQLLGAITNRGRAHTGQP